MNVCSVVKLAIACWQTAASLASEALPSGYYKVVRSVPEGPSACAASPPTKINAAQETVIRPLQVLLTSFSAVSQRAAMNACSFPFTFWGMLFHSCQEYMPGKYGCLGINAEQKSCDTCIDFVAKREVMNLTVPTERTALPVMSVFGWIEVAQNLYDGFNWNLPWADYKAGFGSADANFWFGLERFHLLTSSQPYRLRVEVQHRDTSFWLSMEYWSIYIGNEVNDAYRLVASGYSGDVSLSLDHQLYFDIGFDTLSGMKFSTYDRDNDLSSGNCAEYYRAGWWYSNCFTVCLTCDELAYQLQRRDSNEIVKFSRMMIKPQ